MTIINKMVQKDHLDGEVLGCTELPLILGQEDFKNIQVFYCSGSNQGCCGSTSKKAKITECRRS
ncbi:hypothetical protein [Lactobacillus intestinalis]|uniref:hypothetical protein n=1 Tax=Lactobacillus intestinalis TaxID=151781 RepID=UPI000B0B06E5|nr:hypothetical protein [Lactobacillus intestinalis]